MARRVSRECGRADAGRGRAPGARVRWAVVICAGAGLLVSLGGGCNLIGAAFVLAHGPRNVRAAYKLDSSQRHVILIDDLSNRVPRRSLRDDIGGSADQNLLDAKAVKEGNLISSSSARRAASSDTADDRQSAVDIGRKVGAEVIIYVSMTGWTLQQDPGFISPAASGQVRVLDVVGNRRLWPEGEQSYPLVVRLSRQAGDLSMSLSEKSRWEQTLAREFGEGVAKLFYAHEKDLLSQQARPSDR